MSPFDPADAKVFLQDAKLALSVSDQVEFAAFLDYPEQVENFGAQSRPGMVLAKPQITYETASVTLAHGSQVTLDGVNYQVRWVRKLDDGTFSAAELLKL